MDTDSEDFGDRIIGPWITGFWANKFKSVIFGIGDVFKAAAKEAALATLIEHCPDDAVPWHGRQRGIDQAPGESIGAWRERLLDAWTFWQNVTRHSSAHKDLQDALRLYMGLETLYVYDVNAGGDDWLAGASGSGEDANYDNWSRLVVVIEKPHGWEVPTIGAPATIGPDNLIGITMTRTELSRLRRYFAEFRPAHVIGIEAWIIMDTSPAEDFPPYHTAGLTIRLALHAPLIGYRSSGLIGSERIGIAFT